MPPSINYDSPGELRAFLKEHGLGMRKKYGQNFLINPAARSHLIDALDLKKGDQVWEIGPGLGAMTKMLLEKGARVTGFEIDPAFSHALKEFFSLDPAFDLVEGDVFKTWPAIQAGEDLYLLGNLPYNIAAAILADFIEKGRFFKRMVVTVQKEVALRMAAGPSSADYSSFSVLCSTIYKISPLKIIRGSSFYPVPNVDSRGVCLELLDSNGKRSVLFNPLVRSLFSGRRKKIRNTLSAFAASVIMNGEPGVSSKAMEAAEEALRQAGISGERRPETLSPDEFTALAAFLEGIVHE